MKVSVIKATRIGNRRLAEGDEIDLPVQVARQYLRAGFVTAIAGEVAQPEAEEEHPKKKKTYKTRAIEAEDND